MTTTLDAIHHDPAIIDRAIASQAPLDIVEQGQVRATLLPVFSQDQEASRQWMREKFAAQDWKFSVGVPMSREERNARG